MHELQLLHMLYQAGNGRSTLAAYGGESDHMSDRLAAGATAGAGSGECDSPSSLPLLQSGPSSPAVGALSPTAPQQQQARGRTRARQAAWDVPNNISGRATPRSGGGFRDGSSSTRPLPRLGTTAPRFMQGTATKGAIPSAAPPLNLLPDVGPAHVPPALAEVYSAVLPPTRERFRLGGHGREGDFSSNGLSAERSHSPSESPSSMSTSGGRGWMNSGAGGCLSPLAAFAAAKGLPYDCDTGALARTAGMRQSQPLRGSHSPWSPHPPAAFQPHNGSTQGAMRAAGSSLSTAPGTAAQSATDTSAAHVPTPPSGAHHQRLQQLAAQHHRDVGSAYKAVAGQQAAHRQRHVRGALGQAPPPPPQQQQGALPQPAPDSDPDPMLGAAVAAVAPPPVPAPMGAALRALLAQPPVVQEQEEPTPVPAESSDAAAPAPPSIQAQPQAPAEEAVAAPPSAQEAASVTAAPEPTAAATAAPAPALSTQEVSSDAAAAAPATAPAPSTPEAPAAEPAAPAAATDPLPPAANAGAQSPDQAEPAPAPAPGPPKTSTARRRVSVVLAEPPRNMEEDAAARHLLAAAHTDAILRGENAAFATVSPTNIADVQAQAASAAARAERSAAGSSGRGGAPRRKSRFMSEAETAAGAAAQLGLAQLQQEQPQQEQQQQVTEAGADAGAASFVYQGSNTGADAPPHQGTVTSIQEAGGSLQDERDLNGPVGRSVARSLSRSFSRSRSVGRSGRLQISDPSALNPDASQHLLDAAHTDALIGGALAAVGPTNAADLDGQLQAQEAVRARAKARRKSRLATSTADAPVLIAGDGMAGGEYMQPGAELMGLGTPGAGDGWSGVEGQLQEADQAAQHLLQAARTDALLGGRLAAVGPTNAAELDQLLEAQAAMQRRKKERRKSSLAVSSGPGSVAGSLIEGFPLPQEQPGQVLQDPGQDLHMARVSAAGQLEGGSWEAGAVRTLGRSNSRPGSVTSAASGGSGSNDPAAQHLLEAARTDALVGGRLAAVGPTNAAELETQMEVQAAVMQRKKERRKSRLAVSSGPGNGVQDSGGAELSGMQQQVAAAENSHTAAGVGSAVKSSGGSAAVSGPELGAGQQAAAAPTPGTEPPGAGADDEGAAAVSDGPSAATQPTPPTHEATDPPHAPAPAPKGAPEIEPADDQDHDQAPLISHGSQELDGFEDMLGSGQEVMGAGAGGEDRAISSNGAVSGGTTGEDGRQGSTSDEGRLQPPGGGADLNGPPVQFPPGVERPPTAERPGTQGTQVTSATGFTTAATVSHWLLILILLLVLHLWDWQACLLVCCCDLLSM